MAIGGAQFGSGLLSVTFCRPSMHEIGVRVVVGRCDHRAYNAYYGTSLGASDMPLTKDTNVNVRVQCTALSYDSGALGVDGDLPASYHDIADLNNDPVTYDDYTDLSTIRGDSVRYFVIPDPNGNAAVRSIDISTDAVSGSTGGRLASMTLTGKTLPKEELRGGALSCQKHSYYDDGAGERLYRPTEMSAWHGWDQGTGEAKHTYGTPTQWTVSSVDASGNVSYTGTGDPANGDLIGFNWGGVTQVFGYVSSVDTGANTFVATDHTDTAIDFVAGGWTSVDTMTTVGDEPPAGLSGLHIERILDNTPHFYCGVDDVTYTSRQDASNYLPIINTAHDKGAFVRRNMGNTDTLENATVDRDTGTHAELNFYQKCRFYFLQPYTLECLQQAAGVFVRGDWDCTPHNDFAHVPFFGVKSVSFATFGGSTDNSNPMLDANWDSMMSVTVDQYKNGTDAWNLYFAGGNPPSFVTDKTNTEYPPCLTVDASGNSTINPVTQYGAAAETYYNRAFTVENERHCIICPDSMSHRGGRFGDAWDAHPYCTDVYPAPGTKIMGGEHVWGPYQEAEVYKKVNAVKDYKSISFLNKGMVILGSYLESEINPDSGVLSAVEESARIASFLDPVGAIMMTGDRHVTPTERAAGKGRAAEGGFIQQIIAGAHQDAYGTDTDDHDLTLGLITGTATQINYQTKLITGTVLASDSLEVPKVARLDITFNPGEIAAGTRSGGGLVATTQLGGTMSATLTNSDGTVVAEIVGLSNKNGGPAGGQGAELTFKVGGEITSTDDGTGDDLPDGFQVTLGGFTFLPANVTVTSVYTLNSVQFKRYTIGGGTSFWGNDGDYLDPVVQPWAASTAYTAGDKVRSVNPNIYLETSGSATSGTTAPEPDGEYGTTVSDGVIPWGQILPTDEFTAEASWTDPTASSGGSGGTEGLLDQNLLIDENALIKAG